MSSLDQISEQLFAQFCKAFPLDNGRSTKGRRKEFTQSNIDQQLRQFYEEAQELRRNHGLWVISWARVVWKLQQRMATAGYPGDMVNKVLFAMLVTASGKNGNDK